MLSVKPLVLVVSALVVLWVIGKFVARAAKRRTNVQTLKRRAQILKRTSLELQLGLNVGGLNEETLEELKKDIGKRDELTVSLFLATHRPIFFEIEDLIEKLREQYVFLIGSAPDEASEFDKISAANSVQIPSHPQAFRFHRLSKNELRLLYDYDPDKPYIITEELIEKFGGFLFMENLIMYDHLCREQPAIFHIPEGSEIQRLFQTFEKSGIAVHGKKIELKDRLHVLNLQQLQDMAKEVKLERAFNDKNEAVQALSAVPSASVLLATIYPTSELYLLHSENLDVKAVEKEWMILNIYAKLLTAPLPKSAAETPDDIDPSQSRDQAGGNR
jgi:hypothetical protein